MAHAYPSRWAQHQAKECRALLGGCVYCGFNVNVPQSHPVLWTRKDFSGLNRKQRRAAAAAAEARRARGR
jgi:hypothetical protein